MALNLSDPSSPAQIATPGAAPPPGAVRPEAFALAGSAGRAGTAAGHPAPDLAGAPAGQSGAAAQIAQADTRGPARSQPGWVRGPDVSHRLRPWRRQILNAPDLPDGCFIRPARRGDAAALGRILSDWIDETPWMPRIHSRQQDRAHAGQVIRTMSVSVICQRRALLPARPVGFLARRDHFIHALYLAPQARARGLGGALMAEAKRAAPRLELWCFQANLPARAFYRKHGFSVAEFGDGSGNDEGLPDLRLCWSPV